MSLQDPTEIIKEYPLYPQGTIQFGYGKQAGMRVGTDPLMAKISIPAECGLYPSGWFSLTDKSTMKVFSKIEKESFDAEEGKRYFIPQDVLLDCFEYHWQKLYYEKESK